MGNDDKNLTHFGGKDKSRGVKHRKDKDKYKPKSTKDPKAVPPKSQRNLGSNWDRYEKEDDSQSFQLTSSTDFSILANAPITQGQHFQFKHDKHMAEEIEKTPQDLFSLDLNMLKHSILTVPFYERVGIDEKYFTENQLSYMKKNAEATLLKYNEKYNSKKLIEESTTELCLNNSNDEVNRSETTDVSDLVEGKSGTTESDVSERIDKRDNRVKPEIKPMVPKSENDLEQWLDDILDE